MKTATPPRRITIIPVSLVALLGVVVACSADPAAEDKTCTAKQTVFCRCENRASGSKTCNDDGSAFSECSCGGAGYEATPPKSGTTGTNPLNPQPSPDVDPPGVRITDAGTVKIPDPPKPPPPTPVVDAGPPPRGTLCTELVTCCDQLKSAGYDTTTCLSVADARVESACSASRLNYKNFGDCT